MTTRLILSLALALGTAAHASDNPQPYAGQHTREIKALSAEQIDELLAGRGMGFALPAELNGYPGPRHVLELADELKLGDTQRQQTEALHARMQAEAIALGTALVEAERALEHLFAARTADSGNLQAALERIAEISAKLRRTHLQAHIEQTALLTPDQVATYNRMRGYGDDAHAAGGGHAHGH